MINCSHNQGRLEVIWGCMFSGKSEELLRRLKRAQIAQQQVLLFKPKKDSRFSKTEVVSHNDNKMSAIVIESINDCFKHITGLTSVIGFDEGQMFSDQLVEICRQLANDGKRVIVAGLDQTYETKPFSPMPELAAEAEECIKVSAICVECGHPAHRSQRITTDKQTVLVGGTETYRPLCRHCFNKKTPQN